MGMEYFMQEKLYTQLVSYYMRKTGLNQDVSLNHLYQTQTLRYLLDVETEFYAKHFNEIKYLLELELQGKEKEWYRQAIV